MKAALTVVKQAIARSAGAAIDAVAAAEAELAQARAEVETARADAKRLGNDWLFAPTQAAAEAISRERAEAERIIARAELRIPELGQQLAAAKAERQRERLQYHHALVRAFAPKLIAAVEAAAEVQRQAIALREAAVKELGEQLVAGNIPHLAFNGLLLVDLVAIWANELRRAYDPPPAPRPPAGRTATKANGHAKLRRASDGWSGEPVAVPSRPPRIDPPPEHPDQRVVMFLRGGVELPSGERTVIGDRLTLPQDLAHSIVARGVAEYA